MSTHNYQTISERRQHVESALAWAERHGYLPKGQWYWTSDGNKRRLSLGAHLFSLAEAEAYWDGISAVMNHLPLTGGAHPVPYDKYSSLPTGTWLNR